VSIEAGSARADWNGSLDLDVVVAVSEWPTQRAQARARHPVLIAVSNTALQRATFARMVVRALARNVRDDHDDPTHGEKNWI
jgi:hypothetical protein